MYSSFKIAESFFSELSSFWIMPIFHRPFINALILQFCKCDISESIAPRGWKLYQLIDDVEKVIL